MLDQIIAAANAGKTVIINYVGTKGDVSIREVEPYEVRVDPKGRRHLYAFCTDKQSIRMFEIDRIKQVLATENAYEARWPLKMEPKDQSDDRAI
jgi:predicted DNA-binding transcriptional regulator YafY